MSFSKNKAILVLEDGRTFHGASFGAAGETFGEMVFNTSMTGYQEILTDPSYAGQIVAMTYPLVGNYGVNDADVESRRPWVEGFVVREASRIVSNWRATESLGSYLAKNNIVGIEHIDTRALVRHIRDKGAMRAGMSTRLDKAELLDRVLASPVMQNRELASTVTASKQFAYVAETRPVGSVSEPAYHVVAYDFGVKTNSLREFSKFGCRVTVVPAETSAVDASSLPADVEVTHVNLNDNTVAGLRHKTLPVFSVQYHPESAPGPHDSEYLFKRFVELMNK